jgi:hypothetical protein
MNREMQLKLQAWADGELSGTDATQAADYARQNAEAGALASELRMTRAFLAGNEPERQVPESRDFYWSKIRREIERQDPDAAAAPTGNSSPFWAGLRRFIAPVSGFALVMFVALLSVKFFGPAALDDSTAQLVEVENLSEDMSSISYRSQADNMFVVYLYSKDRPVVPDETDMDSIDELLFQ